MGRMDETVEALLDEIEYLLEGMKDRAGYLSTGLHSQRVEDGLDEFGGSAGQIKRKVSLLREQLKKLSKEGIYA